MLYGEGDHGGGPREPDIEAIERLQKLNDFPTLIYATPEFYFDRLTQLNQNWPEHHSDIGMGTGESGDVAGSWRGSYTSQARTKKRNRDCENLLITAEKFASIGSMLQRKPLFPRVDFREAWKIVLRNQFHDILPGTSIGDVFDNTMQDYDWVEKEGSRLLRFGLEVIGSRIDTRGDGVPLVVYNPHSWPRTDVVRASVRFAQKSDNFVIRDAQGAIIPFQIEKWSEDGLTADLYILVEHVPPVGYTVLRIFPNESGEFRTRLKGSNNSAENEFF